MKNKTDWYWSIRENLYQSIVLASLVTVLVIFYAEWLVGRITFYEPNTTILALETIVVIWASIFWFIRMQRKFKAQENRVNI